MAIEEGYRVCNHCIVVIDIRIALTTPPPPVEIGGLHGGRLKFPQPAEHRGANLAAAEGHLDAMQPMEHGAPNQRVLVNAKQHVSTSVPGSYVECMYLA